MAKRQRDLCPRCGEPDVVREAEGCACLTCGWMPGSSLSADDVGLIAARTWARAAPVRERLGVSGNLPNRHRRGGM